jgi:SAM-dependent methyltransferase
VAELPIPPEWMRALVGRAEEGSFLELPEYDAAQARRVLDLGCGCGRLTRWFLGQKPRPEMYLGLDLNREMIDWCNANLRAPGFSYVHQDVSNPGLNPGGTLRLASIPFEGPFTLVLAVSFFTHLLEDQASFYLDEIARVLAEDGLVHSTWFLFDKRGFPMMQEFQNALFVNSTDPTNAVIYDRSWLLAQLAERRLCVVRAEPPTIRGFHWHLWFARGQDGAELPADTAPYGRKPPPSHILSPAGPTSLKCRMRRGSGAADPTNYQPPRETPT